MATSTTASRENLGIAITFRSTACWKPSPGTNDNRRRSVGPNGEAWYIRPCLSRNGRFPGRSLTDESVSAAAWNVAGRGGVAAMSVHKAAPDGRSDSYAERRARGIGRVELPGHSVPLLITPTRSDP